ncbi:Ammonium transporter Rh type A [Dissostichus eleginoides]|uniref:Ammonium transporter Rh type A n=1 Tax=Dissostichus eleginoides TaxID=100907 RepID=A0AAD9F8Z6_DISEL|nr:Ammonium transporter Rh type A [Dissostichus eleginoides]
MAPQYAPSLRSCLAPMLLVLQLGFILIYAFYIEIESNVKVYGITFSNLYPEFQDVNVMVILGFGYMCTFLVRYGFSGSGFNLLVAVIATQWAIILNGIENWYYRGKIRIDLKSLVVAEMCAASALISIGVVLGKTNPVHLILIALLEVSGFVLNEWLLQTLLKVPPLNSIMMLHILRKGSEQPFEKEKVDRKTGLFSILGTLFLCVFWPSFNSVLVDNRTPGRRLGAVLSTYLALAVSAVTAAAVSSLSSPKGKLNPIHLQSCMLAGGVSIGVSMPAVHQPWEAMTIGFTAAVVSTIGFRYLKSHMLLAFNCHDTCAVLSTHGLPGLLGWLAHLLLQIKDCDDHTTAIRFAVFHICSLLITISLSLCMGIITGLILKWNFWRPPQDKKCFDDQAFWEFPHLAVQK